MTLHPRLESWLSMRTGGAAASVGLHAALVLVLAFSGGRLEGSADDPTPVSQLVMIEAVRARALDGIEPSLLDPSVPRPSFEVVEPLRREPDPELAPGNDLSEDALETPEPPSEMAERDAGIAPQLASLATATTTSLVQVAARMPLVVPQTHSTEMLERLERIDAADLAETGRTRLAWTQDGLDYTAELVLERAQTGVDFDRVIADVSAENGSRQVTTRILLKRLPVSHYTQLVDRWSHDVALHDDEVIGRMHVNSTFNVLFDQDARPVLKGKVSTSAPAFALEARSSGRKAEAFRAGVETSAARVGFADEMHPFHWVPKGPAPAKHEFASDTHIEFRRDGGFRWRNLAGESFEPAGDSGQPRYLIAAPGVTLYLRGVVAGRVLVYSPYRLVIEGDLTYARDPRESADSQDYLGLVCDRDVVIAPPYVTGRGDLDLHAALLAKGTFIVTAAESGPARLLTRRREGFHAALQPSATLRILGSVAAGSLTESEPRYATRVEFDRRFEKWRPPGFPSTNRFVVEDWDRRWTEGPQAMVHDGS